MKEYIAGRILSIPSMLPSKRVLFILFFGYYPVRTKSGLVYRFSIYVALPVFKCYSMLVTVNKHGHH